MEPNADCVRLTTMGTSWIVGIGELMARLNSMEPGAAAADAAEISRIVDEATAIGDKLKAAFADGAWVGAGDVTGVAADASRESAHALAAQVGSVADRLRTGHQSLTTASGVLTAAVAYMPRLMALQLLAPSSEGIRQGVGMGVGLELEKVYNPPMSSTANTLMTSGAGPQTFGGGLSGVGADATGAVPNSGGPAGPVAEMPTDGLGSGDGAAGPAGLGNADHGLSGPAGGPSGPGNGSQAESPSAGPTPNLGPGGPSNPGPAGPGGPTGPPATSSPSGIAPVVNPRMPGALAVNRPTPVPASSLLGRPVAPVAEVRTGSTSTGAGGTPSATNPANATPGAGANQAGSRASSGPYGPTSRRSDDQRVHRPADYLRSTTEGILVLGPQPFVGPPVISAIGVREADIRDDDGADHDNFDDLDADRDDDDDDQELDLTL